MKLSTNHIIVSDLDTPRKDLLVWLVSPPKYGHIENTKKGEALLLHAGKHRQKRRTCDMVLHLHVCIRLCLNNSPVSTYVRLA